MSLQQVESGEYVAVPGIVDDLFTTSRAGAYWGKGGAIDLAKRLHAIGKAPFGENHDPSADLALTYLNAALFARASASNRALFKHPLLKLKWVIRYTFAIGKALSVVRELVARKKISNLHPRDVEVVSRIYCETNYLGEADEYLTATLSKTDIQPSARFLLEVTATELYNRSRHDLSKSEGRLNRARALMANGSTIGQIRFHLAAAAIEMRKGFTHSARIKTSLALGFAIDHSMEDQKEIVYALVKKLM